MKKKHVVEIDGRNYGYTCSEDKDRKYGLYVRCGEDECTVENLFLTEAEAIAYCYYFAKEEVDEITLKDVLENIFNL